MAEKEYKAVAKLFVETKDASKDADAFCKDLKRKLGEIESAADKMTAFKDLASYIEAADKRLAEFKANNQDAFNNMFDGMDASLKVVFENIFKISKDKLVELNNISDQLKNKTADTIDPAALKEWEKSVKGIYALLNEKSGISGHGKIETRFQRLQEAVTNFATVWKGVTDTLSNGFGAGGIASGIQRSPQDIQTELDRLDQQNVRLGKIQQEFQKIKANFDKLNDGENVFFSSDTKFDLSDIKTLVSAFKQAKKTFDNFEGDKNSIEYYEIVLKYMQQAAKLKGMYEALTLNPNEANKEIMKQLKKMPGKKEKETQADILGDVVDKADSALSDGLLESLTKFDKGPLSDLFAQIDSQMTTLEDEIEKLNQATGNAGVGFDKMGQHAVSATEYIRGMTIAIQEMFNALSKASDTEYEVLLGGQNIAIKRAGFKEVSAKTTAEAYLANIMQDTDVDAHTHQGLIANINAPDFKQAIKRQYAGLAKMSAIIGDKDIVTLDLAKVKAEDAYTALNKLKELTNTKGKQSLDVNEFNKIFTDINPEYTNIAQRWGPSKFSDLATYIFNVKQSAQQAFDPVQRLQNLLIAISGKQIDFSKYEDLFKTLSVNNVGDIFNQIAKAEDIKEDGQILQVQDIASGSVQDVVADIQKQKDAFLELRQTAGVTYEEIAQAAKEYSNVYNKAEGQNFEFFKKYFHASEIDEIQKKFMDFGDGFRDLDGLTKELAMEFGIDPDEIESFSQAGSAAQGASQQLKTFYDLVDEIRNKSFDLAGNATDNLEVGQYIERLNSAKAVLDELGDQGQLTAEQIDQVNNAFNAANMHLENSTAHYSGYGYGEYDYSYYEEYKDAMRENDELRRRNSELEDQLKNIPKKAQKSDTSVAQAKIADPIQQDLIRQKAQDAVQSLGTEVKIASLKALADGLVRVSGAVKKASGEWEGFIVKVNEADEAVGLVVDDQSEYAKSLNKASQQVNDNSIFKSEAGKQVGKFDLDRAKLQKDVNIPDSFKQQIQDARTAIANAADEDALKIAINNWEALKNQIHAAAVEQDLYIEKSKNTNTVPDQFTKDLRSQKTSFGKYKRDTEDAIDVTDELKQRLKDLEAELANINDSSGLRAWQKKFNGLKSEITAAQSSYKRDKDTYSQQIMGQANAGLKSAGIKRDSTNLTEDQQKIIDKYKELEKQIGEYNDKVSAKQQAETSGIEQTKAALLDLIATYKQANNIVDAKGNPSKQAYGTAQVQNFNAKYNSLQTRAQNVGLTGDFEAVQNLTSAYEKLKEAQSKFQIGEDLTTEAGKAKVEAFKQAQIECNRYAKELNNIVTQEEKLKSDSLDVSPISEDFENTIQGRKKALEDFVNTIPSAAIGKFNSDFTKLTYTVKNGDGTFTNMTATLNAAGNAIFAAAGETEKATTAFGRFWGELKGKARGIATYLLSMTGFQEIWQQIRQGIQYVMEIDAALTELKKVTNETNATYDAFLQTMSKTAGEVGSTVAELTNSAADWGRLGYSIEEAGQLAATTAKLLNVSEFSSVDEATSALVSSLQAFTTKGQDVGQRAEEIVDILNNIGNKYPVATNELATGLAASGAALVAANNSIEEQVALLSAGNATMQDVSTVAAGLKIVAARLRGTTTEADDDAESAVTNVSKLQEKIKALTAEANGGKGIDIINESGEYKSTYEILSEISKIFDKMDDISQASLLELIAGKNRSSVVAAILQNGEILNKAYTDALNSAGSSSKELNTYLDSIQGRIDLFKNSLQTMWMNFIDDSVVKFIVDVGTNIVKLVDKINLIPAAIAGIVVYRNLFKKQGLSNMFSDFKTNMQNYKDISSAINQIQSLGGATTTFNPAQLNACALAVKNLTAAQQASALATAGLTQEQIEQVLAINGVKDANIQQTMSEVNVASAKAKSAAITGATAAALANEGKIKLSEAATNWLTAESEEKLTYEKVQAAIASGALTLAQGNEIISAFGLTAANHGLATSFKAVAAGIKDAMFSNPFTAILTVATTVISLIPVVKTLFDTFGTGADEAIKKAEELQNEYNTATSEITSNISTLKGLEGEFEKLSKGVDNYGNNISLAADDYARYQEIVETIVGISPSLVDGYNTEGKAIANKNGLLEKSIALMQEEQRVQAQKLTSDTALNTLSEGIEADLEKYKKDNPLPYGYAKFNFGQEFEKAANKYAQKQGNYEGQIYNALNPDDRDIDSFWVVDYWSEYSDNAANFASDFYDQIVADLRSEEGILKDYFTQEQINTLLECANEYDKNMLAYNHEIDNINARYKTALQAVPFSEDAYYKLDNEMQGYVTQYIDGLENINSDNLIEYKKNIISLIDWMSNDSELQSVLSQGFNLKVGLNTKGKKLSIKKYQEQVQELQNLIKDSSQYTDQQKNMLLSMLGLDDSGQMDNEIKKAISHIRNLLFAGLGPLPKEMQDYIDRLSVSDALYIYYNISAAPGSLTIDRLKQQVADLKAKSGENVIPIKTYSVLIEEIEKYNEALNQTSEIVTDNTEVTQEYKDSLIALGISKEELNEYFYEGNELVVKDAKGLNDLVKSAKKNTAENIRLAKSQAKLEYYELYKEMSDLVTANKKTDGATREYVNSLYDQMSALQKTIAQYSLLEAKLLGASNAYNQLAAAQEIDAANDYGSKAEELVTVLADAFKTGRLGTEAVQVAIDGLIPDSVFEDADTLDEKMDKIYEYFTGDTISKLFTIEYDDDGAISSMEMTEDNVRSFAESLFNAELPKGMGEGTIFSGTWDEFTLNPAITSLEDFAKACGVTEEVAFAFLTELESFDISWLGGDMTTLMDQLMGDDLEYSIYNNTKALAELEHDLANGKITVDEYNKALYGLNGQLFFGKISQEEYDQAVADLDAQLANGAITAQQYQEALVGLKGVETQNTEQAVNDTLTWAQTSNEVAAAKAEVERLTNELNTLRDENATNVEIQAKTNELEAASVVLNDALIAKNELTEPDTMVLGVSLDAAQQEIETFKANNATLLTKVDIEQGEDGEFTYTVKPNVLLFDEEKEKLDSYMQSLNEEYTITVLADENSEDSTAELDAVKTAAEAAKAAVEAIPSPVVDCSGAISAVQSLIDEIGKIKGKSVTITTFTQTIDLGTGGVNGTAHIRGTAFKNGLWGAPKTETALVGELGPEMVS